MIDDDYTMCALIIPERCINHYNNNNNTTTYAVRPTYIVNYIYLRMV